MKVKEMLELLRTHGPDEEVAISLSADAIHFLMADVKSRGALGAVVPLCKCEEKEYFFEGVVFWPYLLDSKAVY